MQQGDDSDKYLRAHATATIDAGIQLAKEAALRKDMLLAECDNKEREKAAATIDAGVQLAKEAALRKEMLLAQTNSQGGRTNDEHLRAHASATIDAGVQLAKEAALRKEMALARTEAGDNHLRSQTTATIDAGVQLAKEAALRKEMALARTEAGNEHLRAQTTATIDAGIQLAKEAALRKEMLQEQGDTKYRVDSDFRAQSAAFESGPLSLLSELVSQNRCRFASKMRSVATSRRKAAPSAKETRCFKLGHFVWCPAELSFSFGSHRRERGVRSGSAAPVDAPSIFASDDYHAHSRGERPQADTLKVVS